MALGRRRILAESWRRCEQGSARRPAILSDRSVGVPLPARPARAENFHPSGRQARRRPQRPPHPDRIPPLADDRLPARVRELPRLRIGPRAGGGFPPVREPATRDPSQRRPCRRSLSPPKPTNEHYFLFRSYLDARHPEGGMADMSSLDFAMMVEDTHIDTVLTEYRVRSGTGDQPGSGPLLAVCLTDRLADGLSLVYSFYDPDVARRSLGQLSSFSTISRRRAASACPMSISAIGSRGRRRWATRRATCPRSASACTAGRGWRGRLSGRRARALHCGLPLGSGDGLLRLRLAMTAGRTPDCRHWEEPQGAVKTPVIARSEATKQSIHRLRREGRAPLAARTVRVHPRQPPTGNALHWRHIEFGGAHLPAPRGPDARIFRAATAAIGWFSTNDMNAWTRPSPARSKSRADRARGRSRSSRP